MWRDSIRRGTLQGGPLLVVCWLTLVCCQVVMAHPTIPHPPVAPTEPHLLTQHGDVRIDPYYWLRDDTRSSPQVLAYLQAENRYTDAVLAPTVPLQQQLFEEMVARQQPDDSSVPYWYKGYWYRTRYEHGSEFPRYERQLGNQQAPVELLLDANARAEGSEFYALGSLEVSPDDRHLAVSEDTLSRRQYRILVRSLVDGHWLPEQIENSSGEVVWAADGQSFFYVRLDEETLLPYQVWQHSLGEAVSADRLVYTEQDESFYLSLGESRSEEYVLIVLDSTLTSEVLLIPSHHPEQAPRPFLARRRGHEYHLDHFQGHFYIRSNREGNNFALYRADSALEAHWQTLLPVRTQQLFQQFELFENAIVVEEREQGLTRLRQLSLEGEEVRRVQFAEPAYVTWLGYNPDPAAKSLRYGYSSLTTPVSTYEMDLITGGQQLLKRQAVLGDFDASRYASERLWISAEDGARIPVSLVYRKSLYRPGYNPLLVYGYGAYGMSEEPDFSSVRLSLLDRGFVYAIAHVRGGEELGRQWYEQGRLLQKRHSFTDFIAVTRGLVAAGYGDKDQVYAEGGSAGGLLMGAVINMAPELYRGVIAAVPFVDVLTSMLDETIPLTTGEYDEWGNPHDPLFYEYIKSYSPYDQLKAQAYPHLLVVSGLHDSQVQYWEPAKWVAKLRATKRDDHLLLLSMDLSAGHGGKSGRYHQLRDVAKEYAFLLMLAQEGKGEHGAEQE